MHGRGSTAAVAASLALLVPAGAAGAQPLRAAADPTLSPRSLSPLKLKGSGFERRERVRVTVTAGGGKERVKRLRARRTGSFVVTFQGVSLCDGIEAVAVGRRGSRASFQIASFGCPNPESSLSLR